MMIRFWHAVPLMLVGLLAFYSSTSHSTSHRTRVLAKTKGNASNETSQVMPKILLGFSTGHSGSTTIDAVIGGCSWKRRGGFEKRFPREKAIINGTKEEQCEWVNRLVPQLRGIENHNSTYVDMGHFHNLGYVLECLAEHPVAKTGELAWVHIRRNRYDIANSFSKEEHESPCHDPKHTKDSPHNKRAPSVSYCPHSKELNHNTPIYLPVEDEVWMELTPFQKFLWLADELEYRWHTFRQQHPYVPYLEITWNTPDELQQGIADLRTQLHCNAAEEIPQKKVHIKHTKQSCLMKIQADLEYRRKVGYSEEVQKILLQYTTADSFDLDECNESREDLEAALEDTI